MSGQIECPQCDGERRVLCWNCRGGSGAEAWGRVQRCGVCSDRGTVQCELCDGSGSIESDEVDPVAVTQLRVHPLIALALDSLRTPKERGQ